MEYLIYMWLFCEQAVKSPSLEYSHFVSLPLAIHPELVDKLLNFQKSILGSSNAYQNENLDSDANGDTSEEKDKGQESDRGSDVAVKLKVEDDNDHVKVDNDHVKVDITNIRRVSYPTRASKPSGMKEAVYHSSDVLSLITCSSHIFFYSFDDSYYLRYNGRWVFGCVPSNYYIAYLTLCL